MLKHLARPILAVAALAGALTLFAVGAGVSQAPDRPLVLVAAVEGPIGPATVRHVEKVVERAGDSGAALLVLRLNTPGGLASSMRKVIEVILGSPVPVAGWVAPPGAHAASAGTYILYATHVAAMAPGTNLGAATPVRLGEGMPGLPSGEDGQDGKDGEGEKDGDAKRDEEQGPKPAGSAMEAKAVNDAVALIRSLADMHGRNADWAEKAVREAVSLPAGEAEAKGVVNLLAEDVDGLLAGLQGRQVRLDGEQRTLELEDAKVEHIDADVITRALGILSNPNVALILMMVGVYGLIFEFANPGSVGPGVVGVICLTLGLYALHQLPLDYAGLALVVFGIALMTAEAITPAFGVFGLGGVVSLVIGSAMLIDSDTPAFQLSWWTIGSVATVSAATLVLLLGYVWRAYRRPAPVPAIGDAMVGLDAEVMDWAGGSGHVWARGERWHARGADGEAEGEADREADGEAPAPAPGETVRIRAVHGLTLLVERGAGSDKPSEGD